MANMQKLII